MVYLKLRDSSIRAKAAPLQIRSAPFARSRSFPLVPGVLGVDGVKRVYTVRSCSTFVSYAKNRTLFVNAWLPSEATCLLKLMRSWLKTQSDAAQRPSCKSTAPNETV